MLIKVLVGVNHLYHLFLLMPITFFPCSCRVGNPHRQPTVSPTGPKELAAENPFFFYMPEFERSEIESWFDGNVRKNTSDGSIDIASVFPSRGCCGLQSSQT